MRMWIEWKRLAPPAASAAVMSQLPLGSAVYKDTADETSWTSKRRPKGRHACGQVRPVGYSDGIWDGHREAERKVRICSSLNVIRLAFR